METEMRDFTQHIGRKIERIRRMRGMNQDALAEALNISRQTLSKIEQSETIEDERLEQIARALGSSVDAIRNLNEDAIFNYIQNNYEGSSNNCSGLYHCNFNPLEKLLELVIENRNLYQQLINSEREKTELYKSLSEKNEKK